ncbi:MPT51/MPB51 antigen [Mycobacterium kiyosense]|uniref:MPT51/MPB51 antigen n=2 Tax=Mycobacteriaceae TaxID=1762 RepID=A0A9P3Q0F5_9MYCO|nr:MPT51/MPB51 antigen [Mycobacterium sp. 20KCMC460]GLB80762.1 MPT51/MPB51 antigen [Mycobacterium kiyosense]GLB87500.1 MPT51/MPB51 antigen [Mycobacterium kiyosense]GLB93242.1 MPT51/MPB51 antigen [Mycobacterium kiyosense]GLB99451.1 MPT51/MPB51 antigen [Mycobacterium kiyosense]
MRLRVVCAAILAVVLCDITATAGGIATVKAAPAFESLMVPSAAMGRDIPVAFLGGGPHAVYLLDAFNAAPGVSNWVTAGNAMNTLAGKGISVVAPADGAYSMYTDWEQDGGKQWDTFLSSELPDWLAANKGLAPGGHGVVGAAQGGYAAAALATFHPDRFRYAGSLSGVLAPERTGVDGAVRAVLGDGGADSANMWGAPQYGRWKWHSPNAHVVRLVDQNTRLWVFSPAAGSPSDGGAVGAFPDIWQSTCRDFYAGYRAAGGHNGHFDLGAGGGNDWGTWSQQLGALSGDLAANIR